MEDLKHLTADIVGSFVLNNKLSAADLPQLIENTYAALASAGQSLAPEPPAEEFVGKVGIRKSMADPAHLVSMIDGRSYKTLKRHLTHHGLTPDDYRKRYKLPADYPMVAPGYSAQRSEMAKSIGLGKKPKAKRTQKR